MPPFVLLALVAIFFCPVLTGRVHLATDVFQWYYPWRLAAVGNDSGACVLLDNNVVLDPVFMYGPQDRLLNASLKRGVLPLWDPFSLCGHPLQAVGHPSLSYPPRLLLHALLPTLWAREALLMIHLFLCGWFAYLFLRGLPLSRLASLVGGISWMLGGFAITYLEFEYVTLVSAHLPLLLLLVDRVCREASLRWAAALALALGSMMLVGHWQMVLYGILLGSTWAVTRWVTGLRHAEPGQSARRAGLLAAAFATGIAMSAVQLLPSLELFSLSTRPTFTLDGLFESARFLPENLITLWLADALGSPTQHFWLSPLRSGVQTYQDLCGYIGIVPLVLALVALGRLRVESAFFALAALVALLYAMDAPGVRLLYYIVPGFKNVAPVRMMYIYTFSVAMLAACGVERIVRGEVKRPAFVDLALVAWGGTVAGLALFGWCLRNDMMFLQTVVTRYAKGNLFTVPGYCADKPAFIERVLQMMLDHYHVTQPTLAVPLVLALVSLLALRAHLAGKLAPRLFQFLLVASIAADLLYFGMRFNVTAPAASAYPPAPALELMQPGRHDETGGPSRMACIIRPIHADLPTAYGLHDVAGYGSLIPTRIHRLITTASTTPQTYLMADLGDAGRYPPGLAALLNVRWHCTDPLQELPARFGKRIRQGDLNVYENQWVLPRFFVVDRASVEPDPERILQTLLADDFRPQDTVWLEESPPGVPAELVSRSTASAPGPSPAPGQAAAPHPLPASPALPGGKVSDVVYDLNHISLTVDTPRPTFVVSGDTWYPGWEARIDGTPTPVLRADFAFRAVFVPAGRHRLELDFRPRPFYLGLAISLAAVLASLGCLVLGWPRGRPRSTPAVGLTADEEHLPA